MKVVLKFESVQVCPTHLQPKYLLVLLRYTDPISVQVRQRLQRVLENPGEPDRFLKGLENLLRKNTKPWKSTKPGCLKSQIGPSNHHLIV